MRVLVFGVIYPGVENFLENYFTSLKNQSYRDFDILIIEDGLNLPENFHRNNLITLESKEGSTPANIRSLAIEFVVNKNYDIIIFTDSDDFFSENRIEKTIQSLKNVDFCVNKLIPIDEFGKIIDRINDVTVPYQLSIAEILNANFFGMSNTAININSLPKDFYIPSDILAVDWWIYTILLLNNRKYIYDDKAITFYRQYENNIVGITSFLDKERLMKGISIKQIHYKNLLEYCLNLGLMEYTSSIKKKIHGVCELRTKIQGESFIKNYIELINDNFDKIKTGWWSEILTLDEWSKYE